MVNKKIVCAVIGIGYMANLAFNLGQGAWRMTKLEELSRPIWAAEQSYKDVNSLKGYLNESGLSCLAEREQALNQLKEEKNPKIEQLRKKIAKDMAEAVLTKPGVWVARKVFN